MIKLRLKFKNDDAAQKETPVLVGELLSDAVRRLTADLPYDGPRATLFVSVVNGNIIEPELWDKVKLKAEDDVLISPRLQDGEFGQVFKQVAIIAIAIVATIVSKNPALGLTVYEAAFAVAAVTIAASLALNALIPPPGVDLGNLGGLGTDLESSQMYAISGQSNQIKRLGPVPKVYGSHRIFPTLAANPYTELAVNPNTGEIIQYLCAIYDFGLGSPIISDIRIGDTPLSPESFKEYTYRLVDPNRPVTAEDEFDSPLSTSFTLYQGDRTVTPLSVALSDGSESTQNTDENTDNLPQEIVVDFVCPVGLYGFSSGGTIGDRKINLVIEFAPIGTSDWRSYNDLAYVDHFRSVGGTDYTDFRTHVQMLPYSDPRFDTFYSILSYGQWGSYNNVNSPSTSWAQVYLKPGTNKIAIPKPAFNNGEIVAGTKVLGVDGLLGIIQSVTDRTTYWEATLDRVMVYVYGSKVYQLETTQANKGAPYVFTGVGRDMAPIFLSSHTLGAATILGSSTSPVYSSFRFTPKLPGQYKVRVRRISAQGDFTSQTGDDLVWVGITTNLRSDPVLTTKRHVFMELKIQATDQLNGVIQNLSAIVTQPVDVYDPDTETWSRQVSNNPAWVFCDLLTGEINKKAVDKSRLHLDSLLAWADYCDEVPTSPPGQTYVEPRFQCNFILDYSSTLQEVLNSVSSAAQASLNIIDGKYGVLVDRLKTVPVQIFTPRNSSNFNSNRFYAPRPHALKIKYIDPNLAWEITECLVYENGYDVTNATEFEELTSFACTNYEQAWRFGRYMLAQNRLRQETISLLVDFENLVCTRGDYVQISQDVMQVGGRPARVNKVEGSVITIDDGLDIDSGISDWGYTFRSAEGEIYTSTMTPLSARTFDLDGADLPEIGDLIVLGEVGQLVIDCIVKSIAPNDDMSAQVVLVERANEIFDYESTNTLPDYDPQISNTFGLDVRPPAAVTSLAVDENTWECSDTQSGYQYYVKISWDIPAQSAYELFEIWYNNGAGYRAVDTTTLKSYKLTLDQSRIGTTMGVKVVAVSVSGKKLHPVEMPEVTFETAFKITPPSDVEGFGISITQQVLQLVWKPIEDCDVFKYEIRFSPETTDLWPSTVPLQIVDRNVNSLAVQARTGAYFIKAVDFAGNKSVNAATIITSIPALFDLNVIDILNDAPTFPGDSDRLEFLDGLAGQALILQERISGDIDTVEYYTDGYYTLEDLVDVDDIYSVRIQSRVRAQGFRKGDMMIDWDPLSEVIPLSGAKTDDWDIVAEYRATSEILAMSSWEHLYDVASIGEGAGDGFTDWRPVPTIGDATGRVFQFRIHLQSKKANVTPRLFDATIRVDMPDRVDTLEDLVSSNSAATQVTYSYPFAGPGSSPNVQISIQNAESGDYWALANKNLEGFEIRIYNNTNTQVVRTFDVAAKGYGRRNAVTI